MVIIAGTRASDQQAGGIARVTCAILIIVALSTAPFVAITRWATEPYLSSDTWPYVYSFWGAGLLGAGLFAADVVAPIVSRPLADSATLLVAIAAPVALAVWALVSALWTESPVRTPPQAVLMALILLTAIWFGYALSFRQQVMAVFVALHLLTLPSLLLAITLEEARFPNDDSWIGLFANPNTLGPVATMGIVAAIGAVLLTDVQWVRVAIGACAGIDVVVAWQASSATGWLALCGAIGALALLIVCRLLVARGAPVATVRAAGVAVVLVAAGSIQWMFDAVVGLFGKDTTLTDRREIWDFVLDSVQDRWLIGFGWFSFWDDPENRGELFRRTGRTLDTAHSTFMETLLFLGGIGLLLLLVVVMFGVGRTWWEALGGRGWAMAWWAAVAMFCLLENVTESMIAYHSIFWLLLVAPGFAALRVAGTSAARR